MSLLYIIDSDRDRNITETDLTLFFNFMKEKGELVSVPCWEYYNVDNTDFLNYDQATKMLEQAEKSNSGFLMKALNAVNQVMIDRLLFIMDEENSDKKISKKTMRFYLDWLNNNGMAIDPETIAYRIDLYSQGHDYLDENNATQLLNYLNNAYPAFLADAVYKLELYYISELATLLVPDATKKEAWEFVVKTIWEKKGLMVTLPKCWYYYDIDHDNVVTYEEILMMLEDIKNVNPYVNFVMAAYRAIIKYKEDYKAEQSELEERQTRRKKIDVNDKGKDVIDGEEGFDTGIKEFIARTIEDEEVPVVIKIINLTDSNTNDKHYLYTLSNLEQLGNEPNENDPDDTMELGYLKNITVFPCFEANGLALRENRASNIDVSRPLISLANLINRQISVDKKYFENALKQTSEPVKFLSIMNVLPDTVPALAKVPFSPGTGELHCNEFEPEKIWAVFSPSPNNWTTVGGSNADKKKSTRKTRKSKTHKSKTHKSKTHKSKTRKSKTHKSKSKTHKSKTHKSKTRKVNTNKL